MTATASASAAQRISNFGLADVSDQLLDVFRICLLVLVYLTFFRVIRAVVVELRAEVPAPVAADAPVQVPAPPRPVLATAPTAPIGLVTAAALVIVAPAANAGSRFVLEPETTIGRAAGCAVVIADARVSKLHARVFNSGGTWYVEDLDSTNGTLLDGNTLGTPQPLPTGARLQVGDVVMELV